MKRIFAILVTSILLVGCSGKNSMALPLKLRQELLSGKQYVFTAKVSADYGENLYEFTMKCEGESNSGLKFQVIEPESIAGIRGRINEESGKIEFDDLVLAFPHLANGQLTPVTAPWVVLHSLQSGYIAAAGRDGNLCRVLVDDSIGSDIFHLESWLDSNGFPIRGEILWKGCRILTVELEKFQFL